MHLEEGCAPVFTIASDKVIEAEAIQRARDGDRTVFEYLYRSHSRRVYAICLRMVGNTTEPEDLTQETFLLLLRKIHTFRGESAFSTWLHRLAVNLVLMRLRKKSPPIVSIEATPDPDDETASTTMDIGSPDLSLDGSLDRINLERRIERLPVGYRTIFVLHDIQGYEQRLAAAKMRSIQRGFAPLAPKQSEGRQVCSIVSFLSGIDLFKHLPNSCLEALEKDRHRLQLRVPSLKG